MADSTFLLGGLGQAAGGLINDAGYAVSGLAGHPVQLQSGGLGANLNNFSGGNVPTSSYTGNYTQPYYTHPAGPAVPQAPVGTGQVKGVSTGGGVDNTGKVNGGWYNGVQYWAPGQGPQQTQQTQQASQPSMNYDQIKGEIGSGFDSYISGLQNQLANLTPEYSDMSAQIGNTYGGQKSSLDLANTQNTNNLNAADTAAQQNQAKNLRDLATNYQNALQAGQVYLGAQGAGDSSASNMYNIAEANNVNRERGTLMGQYAGVQNQNNLQRANLGATYNNQLNQLDTWKNTQLTGLSQWRTDQMNKFQNAIGMSEQQKAQAMAAVDQSALQRLQQLDDQATQFKQSIVMTAAQAQAQLQSTEAMMAAYGHPVSADFTPTAFNVSALPQFANNGQGNPGAYDLSYAGGNPFGGQRTDQYGNPIQ